jgi:hypothetical protein
MANRRQRVTTRPRFDYFGDGEGGLTQARPHLMEYSILCIP